MNIITIDIFNTYTGNWENDESVNALKEMYLNAAQDKVETFLGYPTEEAEHTLTLSGIGESLLYVPFRPIKSVRTLRVNGEEINEDDYVFSDDTIKLVNGRRFPQGEDNVLLSIVSGWQVDDVPDSVMMAILRIASLMLQESNGNIGLTGKSMGDNSKTFINYSNYSKYLEPIKNLKVLRF